MAKTAKASKLEVDNRRFKLGNAYPRWGHHPHRDVDQLLHWMVDIQRSIERLKLINEGLHVVARMVEHEIDPPRESAEIMDEVFVVVGQVVGKTNNVYKSMFNRRQISGGTFAAGCQDAGQATPGSLA